MHFEPTTLSPQERALRDEVRAWLSQHPSTPCPMMLGMAGPGHDTQFSRALGAQGWLGLTISKDLGGQGQGPVARLLLTEELLAAQAPVAAHWVADRQSAPVIASHGTPQQQERFLAPVIAGELYFSIGMSEPDAGSDLASVKTTAVRTEGGWRLSGTKVWTTLAHRNDWFIVLCRTAASDSKHAGLSQLLVDLRSPGVSVRVIPTLDGEEEFCEVVLDDVFVPDELLLGKEGEGWDQVTGELAYERGGPDRYLSAWRLLELLVEQAPEGVEVELGRLVARYRVVRELALAAARALQQGKRPAAEAAVTKDLGTRLEQDTVEAARLWWGSEITTGRSGEEDLLASAVLTSPTFTLRGGTTEILRSMIARSATQRRSRASDDLLGSTVDDILSGALSRDGSFDRAAWTQLAAAGLPWVGIDEASGGSGGSMRDAATIITAVGASAAAVPLADTWLGCKLLAWSGHPLPDGVVAVASGQSPAPFGADATLILSLDKGRLIGRAAGEVVSRALSGEARAAAAQTLVDLPQPISPNELQDHIAATRVLLMAGALRRVLTLSATHVSTRTQFGQPIGRFQAVGQQMAVLVEQVARAEMAAELATRWLEGEADRDDLVVATVTAREAATEGARISHQVHGAIGIAAEYDLQLLTRRLWSWRDEGGSELHWAREAGTRALAVGHDELWAWTSR